MIKKTVIINRAVPGSGKTTITNCILEKLQENNINVAIHSTDEYFIIDSQYIFDIDKLYAYHQMNLLEFEKSIKKGIDVIINDNTNITPGQTEAYTNIARDNNYYIIFITLNPRELVKHLESQKVTPLKPDAHEVSEEVLKNMIKEYNIYDDLLNPNISINTQKHIQYSWDTVKNKKIITGIAKHFDSDLIIRIFPNEYKEIQQNIGNKILKLLKVDK